MRTPALAIAGLALMAAGWDDPIKVAETSSKIEVDGRPAVEVEKFAPEARGKYPVVVIVHGASGLGDGLFRPLARRLAAHGYVEVGAAALAAVVGVGSLVGHAQVNAHAR